LLPLFVLPTFDLSDFGGGMGVKFWRRRGENAAF